MNKEMIYGEQKNFFYMEEGRDRIIIHLDELELDTEASTDTQHVYKRKVKTPKVWSEFKEISGYCPTYSGGVVKELYHSHLTALTEKHARAMIAFAKISQLMPYYGGEAGMDSNGELIVIVVDNENECIVTRFYASRRISIYPAFHTVEQAEEFISHEENVQLLKDLYMID